MAAPQLAILEVNPDLVLPEFLSYSFAAKYVKSQIDSVQTGLYVRHLSVHDLRRLEFAIPPLPEQEKIVRKLEHLRRELLDARTTEQHLIERIQSMIGGS